MIIDATIIDTGSCSMLIFQRNMAGQYFIIKSLYVQNTIMLTALGVVIFLFFRSLLKKKAKHVAAFSVWILIVLWFFNSPFFGFSTVCVRPDGIEVNYGILSLNNAVLPLDSQWKIETYFGGIRRMKKLYLIRIADRQSMKVRMSKGLQLLQEIGDAIENMKFHHDNSSENIPASN